MPRNAYEIRFDTLCLAKDILEHGQRIELEVAHEAAKGGEKTQFAAPAPITTEQVLAEAEKLYAFVAQGKDTASQLPGN